MDFCDRGTNMQPTLLSTVQCFVSWGTIVTVLSTQADIDGTPYHPHPPSPPPPHHHHHQKLSSSLIGTFFYIYLEYTCFFRNPEAKNHWETHHRSPTTFHQPCTQKTWEAQERWLLRAFAREQRPGQNDKRSLPGQMVQLEQRFHVICHRKSRSTFRQVQHYRITHPETNMVHERKDFFSGQSLPLGR